MLLLTLIGHLCEGGPGHKQGTHSALAQEEGISDGHACHGICYMSVLEACAAIPNCIDAGVARLQLITHLEATQTTVMLSTQACQAHPTIMSGPPHNCVRPTPQ